MADLYYYPFTAGLVCVALSFAFSIGATFVRAAVPAALSPDGSLVPIPGETAGVVRPALFGAALFALWAAAALFALSAAGRTIVAKAPPMADMWGYFLLMGMGISALGALFASRYREPAVILLVALVVGGGLLSSDAYFSAETRPLIPALQANRLLTLHVSTMMLAYGLMTIAFVASIAFLLKSYMPAFPGFPHPESAYRIAHQATILAFPALTLGIALGAYWANSAWGRYWGWDPKETASALTWLVLVEYMHMQGSRKWRGRRASWVLVLGFFSIVFNMWAVNVWISGLHSYA